MRLDVELLGFWLARISSRMKDRRLISGFRMEILPKETAMDNNSTWSISNPRFERMVGFENEKGAGSGTVAGKVEEVW